MTAQQLAKEWDKGNIVACKQSLSAAYRHLKKELDADTQDAMCSIIEYTNFHDRAKTSVKNWKL